MGAYSSKQFKDNLRALRADDPSFRVLDCNGEHVGDKGAKFIAEALRRNRHLRGLKLGNCEITDVGLARLTSVLCSNEVVLSHLRTLDLSTSSTPPIGNTFGDEGARHLAELLSALHSLRYLRVADCGLGDEGAVFIAEALSGNTSLKTLDLSHNSISDIGAEHIGEALQANRTLEGLYLWHNKVFHSGAEALALGLACNSTLKSLGLGCNSIGDEGVKALSLALLSAARGSQLVWLGVGGNHITDKGVEHLAALLRTQKPLQNRPLLREGHLSSEASLSDQIRASGLRPLLEQGVTPSHVNLTIDAMDDADGAELPTNGAESQRDKTGEDIEDAVCCPLESLGLGGNEIGDEGVKLLAQALYSNTNLLSLGLADNRVGDPGAAALASLLLQTSTLQGIVLSGNDIHDDGGSKIVAALSQNSSLRKLYLAGNPIGDPVGRQCIEVIGHLNTTLQVLDLHNTRMSTPTVATLVQTMRERHVLHALGTQPVPVEGLRGVHQPPRGNMLAMKDWRPPRPPPFKELLRQRRYLIQSSGTIPSLCHTTIEVLGSLPEPKETAQTLVIRSGDEDVGRRKSYRRSISDLWKRLSSRSRPHEVTPEASTHLKRTSKLWGKRTQGSLELQEHDGTRLIEEQRAGEEEEDSFNVAMFSTEGNQNVHITVETSLNHNDGPLGVSHGDSPLGVSHGDGPLEVNQTAQTVQQPSRKDLRVSSHSLRSQRKTVTSLELEPITEDVGETPLLEHTMDVGETPLLEHTMDVGETPLLEHTMDVGETPLLEHTMDVGETPLLEHTMDVGEIPLLEHTMDVGETPLLEHTMDVGETPLLEHTKDVGETPLLEHTMDGREAPMFEHTVSAGGSPLMEHTVNTGGSPLMEHTVSTGGSPLMEHTLNAGGSPLMEHTVNAGGSPSHRPMAGWDDPLQEHEMEVTMFASQNLPLSRRSSGSGAEALLHAHEQRNSIPKSSSFPHNYERSLDDVVRYGSLRSLTRDRPRPSPERRPPTRSTSKSSITSRGGGATSTSGGGGATSTGGGVATSTSGGGGATSTSGGGGATSTSGGGGATSISGGGRVTSTSGGGGTTSTSGGGGATSTSGGGGATSTSGGGVAEATIGGGEHKDIRTKTSIGGTKEEQLDRPLKQANLARQSVQDGQEREEGFVFDAAKRMIATSKPIVNSQDPALAQSGKEEKSLKDQWVIALAKRVGILKMGGFLHNAFEALQVTTASFEYSYTHARLLRNVPKNRDGASLPTSRARVKLQLVFDEVGSDYINASIAGPPGLPPTFVITQSPLENTVDDFWRMVWEHRLSILVLLTEPHECPQFWPERGHTSQHPLVVEGSWVDDVLTVQTTVGDGEEDTGIPGVVVRRFTVSSAIEKEVENLTLYHYTRWPQSGVPESPRDVARVLHVVSRVKEQARSIAPTIVMSTLGAGRAGCFCVVGMAYQMLKSQDPTPPSWDRDPYLLDQVIRGLRQLRAGLVETSQQFEACHRILEEAMWGHVEEEGRGEEPKAKNSIWKIFGRKKQAVAALKSAKGKKTKAKKEGDGEEEDDRQRAVLMY